MTKLRSLYLFGAVALIAAMLSAFAADPPKNQTNGEPKHPGIGRAPESLPQIPQADASAADVPSGYRVEIVMADLTYPTSVAFDDAGTMYVAEAGFNYGDEMAVPRILRIGAKGQRESISEGLNGPITDLLWHNRRLYISHRGKISVLENGKLRDLVTGLPSFGDHHNNQLAVGPDGKIYFGQGTATNSGVVGLDSFKMGWLAKYPEIHDVPAKDIRVANQGFETPDFLSLLADKKRGHSGGHDAKGTDPKDKGHEGHMKESVPSQKKGTDVPKRDQAPQPKKDAKDHDHDANAKGQKKEGHEGHADANAKAQKKEGQGDSNAKGQKKEGHEGHGDAKAKDQKKDGHEGHGTDAGAKKMEGHEGHQMVKTFAFQPFGKTPPDDGAIRGQVKASGTILRMDPDGSNLEVYAWGLRNPFGLAWGPDQKLYASDNGYDERGSRPIAHAPDCLWVIKQDGWYGFPDYAGGVPVTDMQFHPEGGPVPKFVMRDHPPVEKPLATLKHHVGAAKIAISSGTSFGRQGEMFLALSGDMNPITGVHEERSGFEVVRVDLRTGKWESFFRARKDALGSKGLEYVATKGPRRPVGVHFSPDGNALYVVDVGTEVIVPTAIGPVPRPFPGTGVIWRITRNNTESR